MLSYYKNKLNTLQHGVKSFYVLFNVCVSQSVCQSFFVSVGLCVSSLFSAPEIRDIACWLTEINTPSTTGQTHFPE